MRHYSQLDRRWANVKIGDTQHTIRAYGCLICSFASWLSCYNFHYPPDEVNRLMASVNGFRGAFWVWRAAERMWPVRFVKRVYHRHAPPLSTVLELELLKHGQLLVEIKRKVTGWQYHWMLAVGWSGEFIVLDPLAPPLSSPFPISAKHSTAQISGWAVYEIQAASATQ